MLKITSVKIDGLEHGLITDTAPNITFSLESTARAMSWKVRLLLSAVGEGKPDQLNIYDGPLKPFTEYTIHVKQPQERKRASASASFQTGRLDTPWSAQWITDLSYDFPKNHSPRL